MAKSRKTLSDLLAASLRKGETVADWCTRTGFPRRTLSRLTDEDRAPRLGTIALLAQALGVDAATVRSAIEAQRSKGA